MILNNL